MVLRVEDADELGAGEVLVTTVTNMGWTPVFPRVAAVVTDVGAPLSHAVIVARELGRPGRRRLRHRDLAAHAVGGA